MCGVSGTWSSARWRSTAWSVPTARFSARNFLSHTTPVFFIVDVRFIAILTLNYIEFIRSLDFLGLLFVLTFKQAEHSVLLIDK